MTKFKKLIAIAALGVCFATAGGIATVSNIRGDAERAVAVDYLLPLYQYTLEEYDESYAVYNSKGEQIDLQDGSFIAKDLGDYRIEKNGELVKIVRVLAEMPEADFSVVGTMPAQCVAGEKLALPVVEIRSSIQEIETYDLEIFFGSESVAAWTDISESVEYRFMKCGEYTVEYSFVNILGIEETKTFSLNTENEKIVVSEKELPTTWTCYNAYDLGAIYGYYNEKKYEADLAVTAPDQTPVSIENEAFTPTEAGNYTLKINVNFDGETLTEERQISVEYGYASLFLEGSGVRSITNGVATAQDYAEPTRGVETVLSGEGAHVYYNKIIDLESLTKEDSILSFYFDVTKTTATKIRATMIDANDETNKLSVYWYHSPWNADRNSFMLVEFNGYTLGLASDNAAPDEVFGRTLNSSFKRTDDRNAFNFSYDVTEKAVYTKAGAKLLKVMDTDDTALLGARQPFKGFSSNQVYLKIEILEKADAAVIVSEVAGEKFENAAGVQTKTEQYLRLYYDGGYLRNGALHKGAFGYYYTLPVPVTNDPISGEIAVNATLYKNENGQKIDVTDQIKSDGTFLPKDLGTYTVAYSCVDWYGNRIEKEYDFSVELFARSITIANESYTEKLGSYVLPPEIRAQGGTGNLHVEASYSYNGEPIERDRNGYFYLDKSGSITVRVRVTDFLGESTEKTFEILVDNDVQELRIEEKPISFIAGREYVLPDFSPVNHLFAEGEAGRNMSKTILVNGEEIGEDRKYTFTQAGTATITYIGGMGEETEIRETLTVYILPDASGNALTLQEYLIFNGDVETFLFESGLGVNAEEDFEIVMPNAIPLSAFQFAFTAVEGLTNYSKLQLLLEDYKNPKQQLLIEISATDSGAFKLSLNGGNANTLSANSGTYGKTVAVDAGYAGKGYRSAVFKLYEDEGLITAENNIKICAITEYLSGKPFEGFSSGLMRLTIKVCGVSQKTAFVINGISNQKTASVAFIRGDRQGAVIGLMGAIQKQAEINTKAVLPAAVAYDILQGKAVALTGYVELPNGTKQTFDPTQPTELLIAEYGSYHVVYEATDYFKNVGRYEYYVVCKDSVSPSVVIPSGIALSYKVGDTLTVPEFKAEDNVGVTQKAALIKTPANKITVIGEGFAFAYAGKYEIILYAQDANGNYATKTIEVEVK
ncbi:MAG: hypothetical protein IJZ32_02425 [Clostridia bacterium]|nr:hypothetical protein [Clostridia bacterium]